MAIGTCPDCGFHGEYPHTTRECIENLKGKNATLKELVKEAIALEETTYFPRLWYIRAKKAVL